MAYKLSRNALSVSDKNGVVRFDLRVVSPKSLFRVEIESMVYFGRIEGTAMLGAAYSPILYHSLFAIVSQNFATFFHPASQRQRE